LNAADREEQDAKTALLGHSQSEAAEFLLLGAEMEFF
jgi:hypothetical protein